MQNDPTMDWADPCAQNLDELVSALLVYYGQHNVLPPALEQIPRTSLTGESISLSCPESGKKYVYFAQGLRAPMDFAYQRADGSYQEGSRLVLYDAVPVHQAGQRGSDTVKRTVRLAIVMERSQPTPAVPNPSVQMYIVPLEQGILDLYLKANQQSP